MLRRRPEHLHRRPVEPRSLHSGAAGAREPGGDRLGIGTDGPRVGADSGEQRCRRAVLLSQQCRQEVYRLDVGMAFGGCAADGIGDRFLLSSQSLYVSMLFDLSADPSQRGWRRLAPPLLLELICIVRAAALRSEQSARASAWARRQDRAAGRVPADPSENDSFSQVFWPLLLAAARRRCRPGGGRSWACSIAELSAVHVGKLTLPPRLQRAEVYPSAVARIADSMDR